MVGFEAVSIAKAYIHMNDPYELGSDPYSNLESTSAFVNEKAESVSGS